MTATLYRSDGTWKPIAPAHGKTFTIEELYALIETDVIEVWWKLGDKTILIWDEEGTMKRNPVVNLPASYLARQEIVGNVVHCPRSMIQFF